MRVRVTATVAVGTAAAVVLAAGVASAYYLTAVAPTGTGTAATANGTVTLAITGSSTAALYPGGPAGSVTVTVANTFTRPVTVNALQAGTPVITNAPGCTDADLSLTAPTSGLPLVVAASSTSVPTTLPGVVSMGTNAQSACQGATITIPFTVTGQL
jgi:hypothetical protein